MNDDSSGCPGTNREGEPCGHPEGWGVEGKTTGPCKHHGGAGGDVGDPGGAPEGSANALKHGATASPFNLYDNLSEDAVSWIDSLADGYRDVLGFSEDDPRNERVLRACIHIYQSHSGENQIMEDGLSESQTVGVSEETGEPIVRDDGHHLHTVTIKRDKEARQILRTLGAFDDPESQKADAMGDLASIINDGES